MDSIGTRLFGYPQIYKKFCGILFSEVAERMSEKFCPRCGSWKVFLWTQGYYICTEGGCYKLLDEIELADKPNKPRREMSERIKLVLSLR